jgi:hypothetical protein
MVIIRSKTSMYQQVFQSTCLFLLIFVVCCTPPEDPIKCSSKNTNCTITNSYGAFPDQSICQAAEVVYPSNEEELEPSRATKLKFMRYALCVIMNILSRIVHYYLILWGFMRNNVGP